MSIQFYHWCDCDRISRQRYRLAKVYGQHYRIRKPNGVNHSHPIESWLVPRSKWKLAWAIQSAIRWNFNDSRIWIFVQHFQCLRLVPNWWVSLCNWANTIIKYLFNLQSLKRLHLWPQHSFQQRSASSQQNISMVLVWQRQIRFGDKFGQFRQAALCESLLGGFFGSRAWRAASLYKARGSNGDREWQLARSSRHAWSDHCWRWLEEIVGWTEIVLPGEWETVEVLQSLQQAQLRDRMLLERFI